MLYNAPLLMSLRDYSKSISERERGEKERQTMAAKRAHKMILRKIMKFILKLSRFVPSVIWIIIDSLRNEQYVFGKKYLMYVSQYIIILALKIGLVTVDVASISNTNSIDRSYPNRYPAATYYTYD